MLKRAAAALDDRFIEPRRICFVERSVAGLASPEPARLTTNEPRW